MGRGGMGSGTGGPPPLAPVLVTPAAPLCSPCALCLCLGCSPRSSHGRHCPGGCRQVSAGSPRVLACPRAAGTAPHIGISSSGVFVPGAGACLHGCGTFVMVSASLSQNGSGVAVCRLCSKCGSPERPYRGYRRVLAESLVSPRWDTLGMAPSPFQREPFQSGEVKAACP